MARWLGTSAADEKHLYRLLQRCHGCGKLLRAGRRHWTTDPLSDTTWHSDCAQVEEGRRTIIEARNG